MPKRLNAAVLRELRMMVKERVLAPWQVQVLIGVPKREPTWSGERLVKPEEAGLLFAAIRQKLEKQRAVALERERMQWPLQFGGQE